MTGKRVVYLCITAVGVAIALAGVSLAVTLTRPTPPTTRQVTALTARVRTLETGLAQANANLASSNALNDTTKLSAELGEMTSCLPQMEGQLNGINITSGYVTDPTIIAGQTTDLAEWPSTINLGPQLSQDCSRLLESTR